MGKKHFCFFQTAETGNRTPNSGVKGSGANHYHRALALHDPVYDDESQAVLWYYTHRCEPTTLVNGRHGVLDRLKLSQWPGRGNRMNDVEIV